jgi:hypothetical protein
MESNVTTKVINGVSAVLGVMHFVAQSTADLIMEAEANIVNKSIGTSKKEVKDQRMYITIDRQTKVLERISKSHAMIAKAKAYASNDPDYYAKNYREMMETFPKP